MNPLLVFLLLGFLTSDFITADDDDGDDQILQYRVSWSADKSEDKINFLCTAEADNKFQGKSWIQLFDGNQKAGSKTSQLTFYSSDGAINEHPLQGQGLKWVDYSSGNISDVKSFVDVSDDGGKGKKNPATTKPKYVCRITNVVKNNFGVGWLEISQPKKGKKTTTCNVLQNDDDTDFEKKYNHFQVLAYQNARLPLRWRKPILPMDTIDPAGKINIGTSRAKNIYYLFRRKNKFDAKTTSTDQAIDKQTIFGGATVVTGTNSNSPILKFYWSLVETAGKTFNEHEENHFFEFLVSGKAGLQWLPASKGTFSKIPKNLLRPAFNYNNEPVVADSGVDAVCRAKEPKDGPRDFLPGVVYKDSPTCVVVSFNPKNPKLVIKKSYPTFEVLINPENLKTFWQSSAFPTSKSVQVQASRPLQEGAYIGLYKHNSAVSIGVIYANTKRMYYLYKGKTGTFHWDELDEGSSKKKKYFILGTK